jgi:dTDP-4-amino-4,6-dideoxygalactose transaminase
MKSMNDGMQQASSPHKMGEEYKTALSYLSKTVIPRHRHELTASQLAGAAISGGDRTQDCEAWMCRYLRVEQALMTPSGRGAMYWALRAAEEPCVYIPAYTCYAAVEAAQLAGKDIRFVDVDPRTYNCASATTADALDSPGIVIATHQFGYPCDIEKIVKAAHDAGCRVLEDGAGGLGGSIAGRPLGSFGDLSIFSFEHTKTASAWNAGMLVGNDAGWFAAASELWRGEGNRTHTNGKERLIPLAFALATWPPLYGRAVLPRFLRSKGMTASEPVAATVPPADVYLNRVSAYQSRLVWRGLHHLDEVRRARRQILEVYMNTLRDCEGVVLPKIRADSEPLPIRFPVRVRSMPKGRFYGQMLQRGVDLGFSFNYSSVPREQHANYPGADVLAREVINLPLYSRLGVAGAQRVAAAVRESLAA